MNLQSNAVSGSSLEAQAVAPPVLSVSRPVHWSVQRELWENRAVYLAPLGGAALFVVGFLISMIHWPAKMRAALALSPMQQHEMMEQPYDYAALLIMGITFIVGIFYCLDALYGERRDRSILFWKSLPVSDLTTVLSKASIPIVVIPVVTFAITVVTQWIMLMISTAVLLGSGISISLLWNHLSLFHLWLLLFYHLLFIHGLWLAPMYGWWLLVSAWARRMPILWATVPPIAISVFEKITFNTTHFADLMQSRFFGSPAGADFPPDAMSMHAMSHSSPITFLGSPGLWLGLLVAAGFLLAAARLRRYREPI